MHSCLCLDNALRPGEGTDLNTAPITGLMNQLTSARSPSGKKRELAEDSAAEDTNITKQLLNLMQEQTIKLKAFWCSSLGCNCHPQPSTSYSP